MATGFACDRDAFKVVLSEAFEEGLGVVSVESRVGVAHVDVVELGSDALEIKHGVVDDPDKANGRSAAPLWHDEPFKE